MAGLQRSAQTFRRSGSSGLVWDERFLAEGGGAKEGGVGDARGPPGPQPQPVLRHSRSVGSVGAQLRRRGREEAGDAGGKGGKLAAKLGNKAAAQEEEHKKQREVEEVAVGVPGRRKAFRTRDVAPAAEPPSPRVSGCCALRTVFRGAGPALRARPRKRQ